MPEMLAGWNINAETSWWVLVFIPVVGSAGAVLNVYFQYRKRQNDPGASPVPPDYALDASVKDLREEFRRNHAELEALLRALDRTVTHVHWIVEDLRTRSGQGH
jgi:hypothetical protein